MSLMSVMLERSKLSCRLNFPAFCRVEREGVRNGTRCGPGGERAWGAVVVQAACREGARLQIERRAREERTLNMLLMSVTLDVSKLSSLLNFLAPCRVAREVSYEARRGAGREAAGRWAAAMLAACRVTGWRLGEGTHPKHAAHVHDAGRVEAQRFVELLRVLPSRKGGHTKQGEVRAGRRQGGGRLLC